MPIKRTIKAVESNLSNMALIFLELSKMAAIIKKIPSSIDSNFKKQCIGIFNKRWLQFNTEIYLVGFFLHPKYRGKFN
jgi:hypothetical protein